LRKNFITAPYTIYQGLNNSKQNSFIVNTLQAICKLFVKQCIFFAIFTTLCLSACVYGKITSLNIEVLTMKFPEDLLYTNEHMWTQVQADGTWVAGISDYAQDMLGDVVFVEPPKVGTSITAGKPCGLVESVKTGSDLHAPLDGKVIEINQNVLDAPESLNDKPYKSWIFRFEADNTKQAETLLNANTYQALIA
jgi:glycine cleavage system H protein